MKKRKNKQLSNAIFHHTLGLLSALNWFTYFFSIWPCKYGYLPPTSRVAFSPLESVLFSM